jgi:hypothetical protein
VQLFLPKRGKMLASAELRQIVAEIVAELRAIPVSY